MIPWHHGLSQSGITEPTKCTYSDFISTLSGIENRISDIIKSIPGFTNQTPRCNQTTVDIIIQRQTRSSSMAPEAVIVTTRCDPCDDKAGTVPIMNIIPALHADKISPYSSTLGMLNQGRCIRWAGLSLVQPMVCRLFRTKPSWPEPVLKDNTSHTNSRTSPRRQTWRHRPQPLEPSVTTIGVKWRRYI